MKDAEIAEEERLAKTETDKAVAEVVEQEQPRLGEESSDYLKESIFFQGILF